MANVARPPLRQTRLTFSPVVAPNDDAHRSNSTSNSNSNSNSTTTYTPNSVSTRRTSRSGPLLALADDAKPVEQHLVHTPAATPTPAPAPAPPIATRPAPPARANSRKRPAAALSPDATDTRPPTKVTVTRPHGELMRVTNGVSAPLGIDADDLPSARSTPRPGSSGKLAVPPPPPGSTTSQDKRSLRSHDGGSRLKSDLPTYFANYDEVIAGLPQSSELLDFETPIYIVDEPLKPRTTPNTPRTSVSPTRSRKARPPSPPRRPSYPSIPPLQSSTSYHVLDYTSIAKGLPSNGADPLADATFFASHRRAERKEKQLRNIEKERAMHEKYQLERLLDGLLGPDWLKVMGITGVTDGERKDWEPKRDYFIREVEALVDKFRVWKEEEKRLRAEKEAALAAADASSSEAEGEDTEDPDTITLHPRSKDAHPPRSHARPPPSSPPKPRRPPRPHGFLLPVLPPEPLAPFTSFYAKPHQRAAALRQGTGSARHASAFGVAVPEWEEREFELPRGVLGEEVLRDNARSRRRRKRERESGGKGGKE